MNVQVPVRARSREDGTPNPNQPNARAVRVFQRLRAAYGDLAEWRLWLREADDPGGKGEADGTTDLQWRYRRAIVTIRRGLSVRREREVIAHELAHVLLGTIDQAMCRIADLVPDEQREHATDLYIDGLEPVCERLAFALLNLLPDEGWDPSGAEDPIDD